MKKFFKWLRSVKQLRWVALAVCVGLLCAQVSTAQVNGSQNPQLAYLKQVADRVNHFYNRAPDRVKQSLSSSARNLIQISNNWPTIERTLRQAASQPRQVAAARPPVSTASPTIQVSDPAYDYTLSQMAGFTQSETSTAQCGSKVVTIYNDSGSYVESLANIPPVGLSFNGVAISFDGGRTFIDKGFLSPGSSTSNFLEGDGVVACTNPNTFYISSLFQAGSSSAISVSKSTNGGLNFGNPVVAASRSSTTNFLDKEWLAADPTNSSRLYVTYTNFGPSTSIELVRSTDGGATWSNPLVLASTTSGYLQGSQVLVGPQGNVYVAWSSGISNSRPNLVVATSRTNGVSFGTPVTVSSVTPTGTSGSQGKLKGGFRTNQFPSLAVNRTSGTLYVTWQDGRTNTTSDRYSGTYYYSDIFFSSASSTGISWSTPVRVNDNPEPTGSTPLGTDQFQPGIAVDNTGKVAICFYDRRNDPNNLLIDQYCATSSTGSAWTNKKITATSFRPVIGSDALINSTYMGDYDSLASDFTRTIPGFVGAYGDNTLTTAPDVRAYKFN